MKGIPPVKLVTISSIFALLAALGLEHTLGLPPCTWCVIQRFIFLNIALLGMICWMAPALTSKISLIMQSLSLSGVAAAGWHFFEVYVHNAEASCSAQGLMYWVDNLLIVQLLPWLLSPRGDCVQDAASLLGIPLPLYSLSLYVFSFLVIRKAYTLKCN